MSGHGDAVDLATIVGHLAHRLPGQAPLSEFVHHNTLHGDQALGFEAALRTAAARTGARVHDPHARQRARWDAGRFTDADVMAVIARRHRGASEDVLVEVDGHRWTMADVYREIARMDPQPLEASILAWRARHLRVLRSVPSDLPPGCAGVWDEDGVAALWAGLEAALGVVAFDPHPEDLLDALPAFGAPDAEADDADAVGWRAHARSRAARWRDRFGVDATHREWLLAMTGEDIEALVRPNLLRWLTTFSDEGVAVWLPDRSAGLWTAWRARVRATSWDALGLPNAGAVLEGLAEDAEAALLEAMRRLGVPDAAVAGWLERLALRTPGFFGMVAWREGRVGWPAQAQAPLRLMDALAVRAWLEVAAVTHVVAEHLGGDATVEGLTETLIAEPATCLVREALFSGRMPGHLAEQARALLMARARGDAAYVACAAQWWAWAATRRGNLPGRASAARDAWPLFRLALALGLSPNRIGPPQPAWVERLQAALRDLDAHERGQILLEALEGAWRGAVGAGLVAQRARLQRPRPARPAVQLAFCIDDREEAYRRHLEAAAPEVVTYGVAGFFGIPIRWRGVDDDVATSLCPPVVTARNRVGESVRPAFSVGAARADARRRAKAVFIAGLQRLRTRPLETAVVAPVAALALSLWLPLRLWSPGIAGRLERLAHAYGGPTPPTELSWIGETPTPREGEVEGFTFDDAAARVAATLRNIGLVAGFAPLVVGVGHTSHAQNNPHRAAYDCGACGGRHGGPNARVFAAMANHPEVRSRLAADGIAIPGDTWFLGAEHDTADETVRFYDGLDLPEHLVEPFVRLQAWLDLAGAESAHERCRKFVSAPVAPTRRAARRHVATRTDDWFQPRPELGHATNAAAIVGRRARTEQLFLDRRAFLVSYDPSLDPDARLLEGILTAVGPVGAGINLEYYFSTVDDERFGCGTKLTHNLLGMIGVLDGAGGDLRTGLPRQMTEIHDAMRLLLVVEQTPEALLEIAGRQPIVGELVVGGWVQLVSLDPETGALRWFVPGTGFVDATPTEAARHVASAEAHYAGRVGALDIVTVGD
jgi:uncharacterized protein YbcC (UPF0753/DUF2309 family)